MTRNLVCALGIAGFLACTTVPAVAAESRYEPTAVWYVSDIKIEDGQFENYMAWLADEWVKFRELNKKYGKEVGYHVLYNSNPRNGEPDLFLVTIDKDFQTIAEGLATEKKINEAMSKDRKTLDMESGKRTPMRKVMGSAQLLELTLK